MENESTFTQADIDRAREEARAEGVTAGAEQERQRIAGILQHEEAEGRTQQAITMALETDLSAEQAGKLLASAPKDDTPNSSVKTIEERHRETDGAGASTEGRSDVAAAAWNKAVSRLNAGMGRKH